MVKSSWRIKMDFQNAIHQANQLDSIADEMESEVAKRLVRSADELAQAWKGGGAAEFLSKSEELHNNVSTSVQELREIAADIRRVAARVRRAEEQALRLAQNRFSSGGGGGGGDGGGGGR